MIQLVIEDIEFAIKLWFEDECNRAVDGEEYIFEDFPSFNAWLEEHYLDWNYLDWDAYWDFVEVSGGEVGSIGGEIALDLLAPLDDDEIKDAIDEQKKHIAWGVEHASEKREFDFTSLRVAKTPPQSKEIPLEDFVYVCPNCIQPLTECRCSHYPWVAVQIDASILPAVKELNEKGYRTAWSCGGHVYPTQEDGQVKMDGIYLSFKKRYDFASVPEGARYWKMGLSINFKPPYGGTEDEYLAYLEEARSALADWVRSLPPAAD